MSSNFKETVIMLFFDRRKRLLFITFTEGVCYVHEKKLFTNGSNFDFSSRGLRKKENRF